MNKISAICSRLISKHQMYDYYGTKYSSSCYKLKNPPTKCDIKNYIDNFAPEKKINITI